MINKKRVLVTLAALGVALAIGRWNVVGGFPELTDESKLMNASAFSQQFGTLQPVAAAAFAQAQNGERPSAEAVDSERAAFGSAQTDCPSDAIQPVAASAFAQAQNGERPSAEAVDSERAAFGSAQTDCPSDAIQPVAASAFAQPQNGESRTSESTDSAYSESPTPDPFGSIFAIEPITTNSEPPPSLTPDAAPVGFNITVLNAGGKPRKSVLIYHTHTYEAYEQDPQNPYEETERWRTADSRRNTVRVGEELAALLRSLGISVTHDTTAFEPPKLSDAYARSMDMLAARRASGESYDMYIDLHRDAYAESQGGSNTVSIGGPDVARLMLLIGKGEGQTSAGFDEKPDWQTNLAAAQAVTDSLNAQCPGLCRNVCVKSGRYNQHMGSCCVLIEAGNNRNTLEEVLAAMPYLADAIAETLEGGE